MFKLKLKQINHLIDDQVDNFKGEDRDILIQLSNTLFDYRERKKLKKSQKKLEG